MPPDALPPEAIAAAYAATEGIAGEVIPPAVMKRILEAAAPYLAAAERERCARLIETELNRPGAGGGLPGVGNALRYVAGVLRGDGEGGPG